MADIRKSTPLSFAYPDRALPSCLTVDDRSAKRRKFACSHPAIREGMCMLCNREVSDDHSLPFGYLLPSLRLSLEYADRMREKSTEAALRLKKLHLVLDLDHTLLHTIWLSELTPEEERLVPRAKQNAEEGGPKGGHGDIFLVESEADQGMITKLRPSVREFLREAHEKFELTVYTMGNRQYASRMASLLDPEEQYFSDRIISRDDCTLRGRKSLDIVLAKQSNTLILDDTETVWPDHAENLIPVEPYYFFSDGRQSCRGGDESQQDGILAAALWVLEGIHRRYFSSRLGLKGTDVRELVRSVRGRGGIMVI